MTYFGIQSRSLSDDSLYVISADDLYLAHWSKSKRCRFSSFFRDSMVFRSQSEARNYHDYLISTSSYSYVLIISLSINR